MAAPWERASRLGPPRRRPGAKRLISIKASALCSERRLLAAREEQGLGFGGSHPGELPASGRFSEEKEPGRGIIGDGFPQRRPAEACGAVVRKS